MPRADANKTTNTRHRGKRGAVFVTHQELAALWRKLDNLQSANDEYLEVTPGPNGVVFNVIASAIAGTATAASYIVKITSGGPGSNYVGNVYFNGPEEAVTHEGVPITCLQIASTETVPAGTWAIAARILEASVGTSSSSTESTSGTGTSDASSITESLSSSSTDSSSSGGDQYRYYVQMPLFL